MPYLFVSVACGASVFLITAERMNQQTHTGLYCPARGGKYDTQLLVMVTYYAFTA